MYKILNTIQLSSEARQLLETHCEITDIYNWDRNEILPALADKEGLLTSGGLHIDEELLSCAPHIRIISNTAVGYNNFDIEAMKKHQVIGTNTPGVLDDSVADIALSLMLATARRICEVHNYVQAGQWQTTDINNLFGLEVHHKTLGIIGMGRIGEKLAQRAALGMDMNVLYCNRNPRPEAEEKYGARHVSLNDLMAQSDFIVILTPLTQATKGLIGQEQIALMKKTGILVNAARGPVIDEQALYTALLEKKIYGAGLDVFETEPLPPNHPLLTLPNVVTLPHIGSATWETRNLMMLCSVNNLISGLKGEQPSAIIPELLS